MLYGCEIDRYIGKCKLVAILFFIIAVAAVQIKYVKSGVVSPVNEKGHSFVSLKVSTFLRLNSSTIFNNCVNLHSNCNLMFICCLKYWNLSVLAF